MFGWLVKNQLEAELRKELDALRSLEQGQRAVVAIELSSSINGALDLLGEGARLSQVKEVIRQVRRDVWSRASGPTDPARIIGSIPEHLIMLQSEKFTDEERQAGCRSIIEVLKLIFLNDVPALLGPGESAKPNELFKQMKQKYKKAFLE